VSLNDAEKQSEFNFFNLFAALISRSGPGHENFKASSRGVSDNIRSHFVWAIAQADDEGSCCT
jgi:hypothetical protein